MRPPQDAAGRSAVGQKVLFDVVAIGLEHDAGAAQLTNLLVGPLDHAVALAGARGHHFPAAGQSEALLGARLGLHLGHLALLCRPRRCRTCSRGERAVWARNRRHGSPLAGRRAAGLWQTRPLFATRRHGEHGVGRAHGHDSPVHAEPPLRLLYPQDSPKRFRILGCRPRDSNANRHGLANGSPPQGLGPAPLMPCRDDVVRALRREGRAISRRGEKRGCGTGRARMPSAERVKRLALITLVALVVGVSPLANLLKQPASHDDTARAAPVSPPEPRTTIQAAAPPPAPAVDAKVAPPAEAKAAPPAEAKAAPPAEAKAAPAADAKAPPPVSPEPVAATLPSAAPPPAAAASAPPRAAAASPAVLALPAAVESTPAAAPAASPAAAQAAAFPPMQPMTDATPASGAAATAKRPKAARAPAGEKSEPRRTAENGPANENRAANEDRPAPPKPVRPAPFPMRDFLASHR